MLGTKPTKDKEVADAVEGDDVGEEAGEEDAALKAAAEEAVEESASD